MELKATTLGKHLAQHPYNQAVILNARIKVSSNHHKYLIPFNQLLAIHCKHSLVWGKLEFVLPDKKVVHLHSTKWGKTQHFYHHLDAHWQQWSGKMSKIASGVLHQQLDLIATRTGENKWLTREQTSGMQQQIHQALSALPLPVNQLEEFNNCHEAWHKCQAWLKDIESTQLQHNQAYTKAMLTKYADFFHQVKSSPLNPAQAQAVINGKHSLLVLAGAGSRKTSVLVAHAGWLLAHGEASPEQILLLAFGRKATEEMDKQIHKQLHTKDITTHTFHALALHIIQQGSKKVPIVSKLENDTTAHHELFIAEWHKQCSKKKAQAKGWQQWLTEEMQWSVPEGNFWDDEKLQHHLASHLNHWVSLMQMHSGAQAEMIASAPKEIHNLFSKHIKLMAPLLKAWKGALKAENTVNFSGLIHQAIVILEKGHFISPWKHILVDEFQDISPQQAALLAALHKQNSQTTLFTVGDDWQAIYQFSSAQMSLTTTFHENFGEGKHCDLDTTYHFNSHISEVANQFIQQNPGQLKKPLNSLTNGDKKAITLLDESQLDTLLDKLSGYAKPEEHILILARYHHMRPASLEKAATHWPKLQINFMTIHASKGQQADYIIIIGLQEGSDGFPAAAQESIMEEALLPPVEDFPDTEEQQLMYMALTQAHHQVWALFNKENPSPFVEILKNLDVPVARKP